MNGALLRLFHAIEPGSRFWVDAVRAQGPEEVLERILKGDFATQRSVSRIRANLEARDEASLRSEIESCGARFVSQGDSEWPHPLDDLIAPPLGLVIRGRSIHCESVSIVGTRNPTTYGARVASEFAAGFVDRDFDVISGGAYGIDTHAHRGALAAEGRTFAVLASGVDTLYPKGNESLFHEILENGGLISEVMPLERARPERFLTRNRLIAALSRSTIVVEAAFRSGSLRTAREAAEIMRTVLAIPGPITSPTSDGCHRLIGERCAEIVTSVADAMELIPSDSCTLCRDGS